MNMKKQKLSNKVVNLFRNHSRDFLFAVGQIKKNPFGNLLTVLAIAIALALPFGLYTLVNNILHVGGHPSPYLSIYMKKQKNSQYKILQKKLETMPLVKSVQYISPSAGMKALAQFNSITSVIKPNASNPLPGVFVVELSTHNHIAAIKMFANQLRQNPLVQLVQVNMTWVKRLHYNLKIKVL